MFRNVRDDVMEVTRNEQQPFVWRSLSRRAIYLTGQPSSADQVSTNQANATPAGAGAPSEGGARTLFSSAIDPALVGTQGDHGAE